MQEHQVLNHESNLIYLHSSRSSIFLPNNLRHNVIDKLQEDLSQQRQQVIQANEQITTFNLYLQKTDQVEQWTDFYNKFNN